MKLNCEVDLLFQEFYQKCTIHGKHIKLYASSAVVVYLMFSNKFLTVSKTGRSTISVHSTIVSVILYLLVTFYLEAICVHMHI